MACSCGGLSGGMWRGCAPGPESGPGPCAPADPDPCPGSCGGGGEACAALELIHGHPTRPDVCADGTNGRGCVAAGPCGPFGPGNDAVPGGQYRQSLTVSLQSTIDSLRRIPHEMGLRPYHVFLIWTRRGPDQVFREHRRLELVPVTVSTISDNLALRLSAQGYRPEGGVTVSKVSTRQVNEDVLYGRWQGKLPAQDEEFFFELVREPLCGGDEPRRLRLTLASVPSLDGFEWKFALVDQQAPRSPQGKDQDMRPENAPRNPLDRLLR